MFSGIFIKNTNVFKCLQAVSDQKTELSPQLPVDWCLKTKLRVVSSRPLAWCTQLKSAEEAAGITHFVQDVKPTVSNLVNSLPVVMKCELIFHSLPTGNFECLFVVCCFFLSNSRLLKNSSTEIPSECQTVQNQIRCSLIWDYFVYTFLSCLSNQGLHRLEKYLNLVGILEKSLKIKAAVKSTGKSLKSLEKSLNSTIFCRTKHC